LSRQKGHPEPLCPHFTGVKFFEGFCHACIYIKNPGSKAKTPASDARTEPLILPQNGSEFHRELCFGVAVLHWNIRVEPQAGQETPHGHRRATK
jgi:hypothetical protein